MENQISPPKVMTPAPFADDAVWSAEKEENSPYLKSKNSEENTKKRSAISFSYALNISELHLLSVFLRENQKKLLTKKKRSCVCSDEGIYQLKNSLLLMHKQDNISYLCWGNKWAGISTIEIFECESPAITANTTIIQGVRNITCDILHSSDARASIWHLRMAAVRQIFASRHFLLLPSQAVDPDIVLTIATTTTPDTPPQPENWTPHPSRFGIINKRDRAIQETFSSYIFAPGQFLHHH